MLIFCVNISLFFIYVVVINDTKGKEYLKFAYIVKYDKEKSKPELFYENEKGKKEWQKLKATIKEYGDNKEQLQSMLEMQKELDSL